MINTRLKTLCAAFLILFVGNANCAAASNTFDGSQTETSARKRYPLLSSTINEAATKFSNELFDVNSTKSIDGLLVEFYELEIAERESFLTAVIVQAVEYFEGADAQAPESRRKTARLANFLAGNRLLAPTHSWTGNDIQKSLTYLRTKAEADAQTETPDPFLCGLSQIFIAAAQAFPQIYADFYDFTLTQQSLDTTQIFGKDRFMPRVVDIFNEAVLSKSPKLDPFPAPKASNYVLVHYHSVKRERERARKRRIVAPSELSPFGILSSASASASATPNVAAVDADKTLEKYRDASEIIRGQMLTAFIEGCVEQLNESSNVYEQRRIIFDLMHFLLRNRCLPPLQGWLDAIAIDTKGGTAVNVRKLKRLTAAFDGSAPLAAKDLDILNRTFKSAAAEFEATQSLYSDFARIQRSLDKDGTFGEKLIVPNALAVIIRCMREVDETQVNDDSALKAHSNTLPPPKDIKNSWSLFRWFSVGMAATAATVGIVYFLKFLTSPVKR